MEPCCSERRQFVQKPPHRATANKCSCSKLLSLHAHRNYGATRPSDSTHSLSRRSGVQHFPKKLARFEAPLGGVASQVIPRDDNQCSAGELLRVGWELERLLHRAHSHRRAGAWTTDTVELFTNIRTSTSLLLEESLITKSTECHVLQQTMGSNCSKV